VGNVMNCLMFDTAVSYNSALSLYTTTTHPAWLSAPADSMHTITPRPVTVSVVPDLTVSDLCSAVLGLSQPDAGGTLALQRNLLTAGEPMVLLDAEPGTLTVLDADGRLLARARTVRAPRLELPTAGWASGLKLAHWHGSDGAQQRTIKLMIE
jgi:hypothetical protein